MFSHYQTTILEDFVEDVYRQAGITEPNQLSVKEISSRLNIWVHYERVPSRALEATSGMYSMFLDSRLPAKRQYVDFLHELCHLLRHAGNQMILPKLFTEAQEAEAENFVLYAAMPFSMICNLEFPDNKYDMVNFLSKTFRVPLKLAEKRLDQILRRECEGLLWSSYSSFDHYIHQPSASEVDQVVYAYYDPSGDYMGPSQIIVQVDEQTLLSKEELLFSPDGPFECIEEHQLQGFADCKPVKFHDLDYTRDGRISIRLKNLAVRYYNSFKFIVQRKDIEQLLHFYGAEF